MSVIKLAAGIWLVTYWLDDLYCSTNNKVSGLSPTLLLPLVLCLDGCDTINSIPDDASPGDTSSASAFLISPANCSLVCETRRAVIFLETVFSERKKAMLHLPRPHLSLP